MNQTFLKEIFCNKLQPEAVGDSDLREFSGIVFPTKRRIFPRQPDGHSAPELLVVSIDLDQFVLS